MSAEALSFSGDETKPTDEKTNSGADRAESKERFKPWKKRALNRRGGGKERASV